MAGRLWAEHRATGCKQCRAQGSSDRFINGFSSLSRRSRAGLSCATISWRPTSRPRLSPPTFAPERRQQPVGEVARPCRTRHHLSQNPVIVRMLPAPGVFNEMLDQRVLATVRRCRPPPVQRRQLPPLAPRICCHFAASKRSSCLHAGNNFLAPQPLGSAP